MVSPTVSGIRVLSANRASASGLSTRNGSSIQNRPKSSTARAIVNAAWGDHRECISSRMSMSSPAAARVRSMILTPSRRSDRSIQRPPERRAASSKGQIFMAVTPLSRRLATSSSGRVTDASRSSYGPSGSSSTRPHRFRFTLLDELP